MQKAVFIEIKQIYSSICTSILSFWTSNFTYYFHGLNNFEFAYPVCIRLPYFAQQNVSSQHSQPTVRQHPGLNWLAETECQLDLPCWQLIAEMNILYRKANKSERDDCTVFPCRIWYRSSPQLSAHLKHLWTDKPVQVPRFHGCSARQMVQGCSMWETKLCCHGGKQWTRVT